MYCFDFINYLLYHFTSYCVYHFIYHFTCHFINYDFAYYYDNCNFMEFIREFYVYLLIAFIKINFNCGFIIFRYMGFFLEKEFIVSITFMYFMRIGDLFKYFNYFQLTHRMLKLFFFQEAKMNYNSDYYN